MKEKGFILKFTKRKYNKKVLKVHWKTTDWVRILRLDNRLERKLKNKE